jgi:hypothetical protein
VIERVCAATNLWGVIYETLHHPPQNLSGFDFRSATGADNLGKSGMPYARTVKAKPRTGKLPNAQQGFDALMKRETKDGMDGETVRSNSFTLSGCIFLTAFD